MKRPLGSRKLRRISGDQSQQESSQSASDDSKVRRPCKGGSLQKRQLHLPAMRKATRRLGFRTRQVRDYPMVAYPFPEALLYSLGCRERPCEMRPLSLLVDAQSRIGLRLVCEELAGTLGEDHASAQIESEGQHQGIVPGVEAAEAHGADSSRGSSVH
jgi:hypothetical protein